ncbi:MAG: Gfo/Idh/MocA family protein [Armatimonadota bacterium]
MEELGVAIIGFGFIGKVHAHAYRSMPLFYDPPPPACRLVGVCTSREETAAKAKQQGGFQVCTTDFRELIARDDVHIVNVCTPNDLHKPVVLAALAAGKHVYCDKPLALNLSEAREIAAAARRSEVTQQMTFHMRFIPAIMRAKELAAEGFLGRIYHFRVAYLHCGYSDPDRPLSWRLTEERGGAGALADLGSHVIDLTRHLLGDLAAVNAHTETFITERPIAAGVAQKAPVQVDDYCLIRARLAQGGVGIIEASRYATGTNDDMVFEVYGERGALRFNLMQPNYLEVYDQSEAAEGRGFKRVETVQRYPEPSALPSPKLPVGWIRFHIASLHSFLTHVAAGEPGDPDLIEGARTQAVMQATLDSARSGQWEEVEDV